MFSSESFSRSWTERTNRNHAAGKAHSTAALQRSITQGLPALNHARAAYSLSSMQGSRHSERLDVLGEHAVAATTLSRIRKGVKRAWFGLGVRHAPRDCAPAVPEARWQRHETRLHMHETRLPGSRLGVGQLRQRAAAAQSSILGHGHPQAGLSVAPMKCQRPERFA